MGHGGCRHGRARVAIIACFTLAIACVKSATAPSEVDAGDGVTDAAADSDGAVCGRWPVSADSFDASTGQGCRPFARSGPCAVPSGGTTDTCVHQCTPNEYGLWCWGAGAVPDPALGCHLAPPNYPPAPGGHGWPLCCPCTP